MSQTSGDRAPAPGGVLPGRPLRLRWPLVLGVWAIPALLAAFETYMFGRAGGHGLTFWRAAAMEAPAWLVYALLTPAVVALVRRPAWRRAGRRQARTVGAHVLACLAAGAAYTGIATATTEAFGPSPRGAPFGRMWAGWFLSALPLTTLTYAGIVGVGAALTYFAEAERRAADAARLTAQLAEARLGALRMQLHPHFLFNTLNAITVVARDEGAHEAARLVTLLAELLREVLRTDAAHLVPLDAELAFLRRYLAVERVRFADRLAVRECVEPGLRRARVPAFVLQPLVENALRHGLAPRAAGGVLEIGARRDGADVVLWVRDDGAGLPAGWAAPASFGVGLSNTAARLTALYGGRAALGVGGVPGGGTIATVCLPDASSGGAALAATAAPGVAVEVWP